MHQTYPFMQPTHAQNFSRIYNASCMKSSISVGRNLPRKNSRTHVRSPLRKARTRPRCVNPTEYRRSRRPDPTAIPKPSAKTKSHPKGVSRKVPSHLLEAVGSWLGLVPRPEQKGFHGEKYLPIWGRRKPESLEYRFPVARNERAALAQLGTHTHAQTHIDVDTSKLFLGGSISRSTKLGWSVI